jgi:hypothetical protein
MAMSAEPTEPTYLGDGGCFQINRHEMKHVWMVDSKFVVPTTKHDRISTFDVHGKTSKNVQEKWLMQLCKDVDGDNANDTDAFSEALTQILDEIKKGLVKLRGKRKRMTRIIDTTGDVISSQVTIDLSSGCSFEVLSSFGAHGCIRFVASRI